MNIRKQAGYLGVGGKRVIGGLGSNTALDAYIRSLGPAAWFLKGQGQTVTGSGVSQWDDLSGNGRHLLQSTDAARPALQADGSVLFNGTSHYLKCNAFTLNQPTCVLFVGKQVSWTDGDYVWDGNTAATMGLAQLGATPNLSVYAGAAISTNPDLPLGTIGVISAVYNGASSSVGVDRNAAVTGDAGAGNGGGFTLGAAAGGFVPSHIQVYETVIFPIAPSTAQLDRLVAGLMARHSIP